MRSHATLLVSLCTFTSMDELSPLCGGSWTPHLQNDVVKAGVGCSASPRTCSPQVVMLECCVPSSFGHFAGRCCRRVRIRSGAARASALRDACASLMRRSGSTRVPLKRRWAPLETDREEPCRSASSMEHARTAHLALKRRPPGGWLGASCPSCSPPRCLHRRAGEFNVDPP